MNPATPAHDDRVDREPSIRLVTFTVSSVADDAPRASNLKSPP
jgi:hypothetical protein